MIKQLIRRILRKPAVAAAPAGAPRIEGKRMEVPASEHRIDPTLVDERAVKVVQTLQDAGHEAYIVGGAVRDLLLGLRPKDFDVATNATPEQVKALFRRAFIIGRRFRIVHVVYGRGREHEVIEVSTFRAYLDASAAEQVAGNERTAKSDLVGKSHVVDASGRVLRDNVWGPQIEDAARRDFTINAMYYDPRSGIVVDYHHGIRDARARLLRMIGDPAARYREDPVRIVRVVRFAAKLGFEIEPKTRKPIRELVGLLDNVPQSRLFDEMLKLLQTGHALASVEELRKQGLHRGVFPILDAALVEASPQRQAFVQRALSDTDRRVSEGKPVAPSFMLACLLWHDVQQRWAAREASGQPPIPALQDAIDEVFDARIGDISGRGKLAADMREIWMMQPRFARRTPSTATSLVQQPRFRAGFDFLRLLADVGQADADLARWWEDFSLADEAQRQTLLQAVKPEPRRARKTRRAPDAGAAATASGSSATPGVAAGKAAATVVDLDLGEPLHDEDDADPGMAGAGDTGDTGGTGAGAPRKRRRRRRSRKSDAAPADGEAASSGE